MASVLVLSGGEKGEGEHTHEYVGHLLMHNTSTAAKPKGICSSVG